MRIPDFLKPENIKPNPKADDMMEAIERYIEHFGDGPITEGSYYSDEEWTNMLNKCVDKNITIWELTREEYDPESEY